MNILFKIKNFKRGVSMTNSLVAEKKLLLIAVLKKNF